MVRKARPGKPETKVSVATKKLGSTSTNKRVMRSIIIKAQGDETGDSNEIEDKPWVNVNDIVEPPYSLLTLSMLRENSTELQQCVDAMVTNIDSFGYRLVEIKLTDEEKLKLKGEIEKEKASMKSFLTNVNFDENITKLRKLTRKNIEDTGNAYWEFVPYRSLLGISSINRIRPHKLRITNLDKVSIEVELPFYNEFTKKVEKRKMRKKFRRFVQIVNNTKVYFKEYGDPRFISKEDGKVIKGKEKINEATKKGMLANPVYHFKVESDRTPYGIPRYIGNLLSIYGSRAADEINFITFQNNNIPSMIISVSNGQMTEASINRIQEFVDTKIKGSNNLSSFLIIEAEPSDDVSLNPGTMKMDIKDLSSVQKEDQLFQNYDKNNADKIRRCFRLPQSLVGKSSDSKNINEEKKLAEEQVFKPERDDFDIFMNKLLVAGFEMKYHVYKSNSSNVTNDADLVKVLSSGEKTGGVTPNLSRQILSDVLNRDIPEYNKEKMPFDPDIPLSYTLVEMSQVVGGNGNTGKIAPNQGQVPKNSGMEIVKDALKLEVLEDVKKMLTTSIFEGMETDEEENQTD